MPSDAPSLNFEDLRLPEMRFPSPETLELAFLIKDRLGRRTTAPVRTSFVRNLDAGAGTPPLARLLRSGRASDVRIGLYLTFLWFAAREPFDLAYPARAWAILLGLDEPATNGTRRIRQAMTALNNEKLIEITPRAGQPSRVVLRDESGADLPYTLPGQAYNRFRNTPDENRHRYIQIPDTLWTRGWISVLSGPALAMLLVLLTERSGRAASTDLWLSEKAAKDYYAITTDTRSRGLRELRAAGLVTARRAPIGRDALDFQRMRNTYRVVDGALDAPAAVPVNPEPDAPMRPGEEVIGAWSRQFDQQADNPWARAQAAQIEQAGRAAQGAERRRAPHRGARRLNPGPVDEEF